MSVTAIAIMREPPGRKGKPQYRAFARSGLAQSTGNTAGEALDALTAQLPAEERGSIVLVQEMAADRYFGANKIHRLAELMAALETSPSTFSAEDRDELQVLIEEEFRASAERTAALANAVGR